MLFLCYPKCSTCRKAQKWLDEHDVDYDIRDIKTDNPDLAELELWHQASGLPLKKFFNTSGQLYRSLELSKKLPGMSDAEQYALLASDGMLVKRPILITDENQRPIYGRQFSGSCQGCTEDNCPLRGGFHELHPQNLESCGSIVMATTRRLGETWPLEARARSGAFPRIVE